MHTVSGNTLAVSEASDLILKDIRSGIGVDAIKRSRNAVSRLGWGCDTESAVGIAACEDGRALANVFKRAAGASQVAGVVLTLLLDESRKILIGGNGGLDGNHLGANGRLNGNHIGVVRRLNGDHVGVMGQRLNGNHLGRNSLRGLAGNLDGDD